MDEIPRDGRGGGWLFYTLPLQGHSTLFKISKKTKAGEEVRGWVVRFLYIYLVINPSSLL